MEEIIKGDVVVIPFPFSDLTSAKRRPALVVANLAGDDYILAQITTVVRSDEYAIPLGMRDFRKGNLPQPSIIRPNKLFTADKSLIAYRAGNIKEEKIKEVEQALVKIFTK